MNTEAQIAPMSFEALRTIAAKRGTVRWNVSGIIEHLRLHKNGSVIARRVKEAREHLIKPHADVGYHCIEVDRDTKLPVDHPNGFAPMG